MRPRIWSVLLLEELTCPYPMCHPMWSHCRHVANMTQLVLPSTHPSWQPKRQIDRFSRFCTAHGKVSSHTLAPPGEYDWNCSSFGSAHQSPQPKRQIDQFNRFYTTHGRKSLYFTMGDTFLKNCPFSWGIWTTSDSIPWASPSPQSKRHLDRFSHFCRAH